MPDPGIAADRVLLVDAVTDAGALAADWFARHAAGGMEAWDKSPGNPVSDADLAVDAFLKDRLLGARPDYGWLSEETADDAARLGRVRVWVVDPIDGTRDFLRGHSGWTVSAALVEHGQPVLGVLAAPVRRQLYVAERGRGATRDGAAIAVSGRRQIGGCAVPTDAATLAAAFWPVRWNAVAVEKPNSLALRIAKVADGSADAFLEGRTIAEWDIAAAALILTEAGGVVTDRDGGALRFNQPHPAVRGLVATTPLLHGEVLQRLQAGMQALAAIRAAKPATTRQR